MTSPLSQATLYQIKCFSCGKIFDERQTVTRCLKCGNPLTIDYDLTFLKTRLNLYALKNAPVSARKYMDLYPLRDLGNIVSMHEGGTPLIHARSLGKKIGLKKLYIKHEGANPTGVFKDRGSMVEITKAIELGAQAIVVASTGNMAGSVSAYAALAHLPCYILIPEGTPIGKLAQTLSYGGRVLQVRGTYADCSRLAEEMSKQYGFYLAGDYAIRLEGSKSIAFEIIEQLDWRVPDVVIMPVGCGTNMAGVWKGFREFKALGLIDRLPRMIAVQPKACSTICEAFRLKKDRYVYVDKPQTIASAVGIGVPQDDLKALACLRESKGNQSTCDEFSISEAQQNMARLQSLFVEPSSALPVAALEDLKRRRLIGPEDVVVAVATGTGLKDPKAAMALVTDPPSFEPSLSSIDHYLKNKLYNLKAASSRERSNILWKTIPTLAHLKTVLHRDFGLTPANAYLKAIGRECVRFIEKGRPILKADLQNIVEEVFNEMMLKKKVLEILDFKIESSIHQQASSWVQFRFHGKVMESRAKGVGTVDATISAIRDAIQNVDTLGMELLDYQVQIATPEVQAVVKVTMSFRDRHNNRAVVTATSPDVIVASVMAFEKGYNILYAKNQS